MLKHVIILTIFLILASTYLITNIQGNSNLLYNLKIFRDGDLIFRKGTGFFSDFFCSIGDEEEIYSHVGIIRIEEGKVFVVHTEASELTGVGHAKQEAVEEFLSPKNSKFGALYRLKALNKKLGKEVAIIALSYVIKKVPFDASFDLNTKNELYCTELVNDVYEKIGMPLVKEPKTISFNLGLKNINKKVISINQLTDNKNIFLVNYFNYEVKR